MAASAPASSLPNWEGDSESNSRGELVTTESLEVGMSGMNLLSSYTGPDRKETGSTVSTTSPPDEDGTGRQIPTGSDHGSNRGSAPPSPSSDRNQATLQNQARPPGLAQSMPSPIGKTANVSKNSSATSPSLTLTPNSSIDGNSDWNSLGRQNSPYSSGDPPPMPYLNPEHRRGVDGPFGSGDLSAPGNDGLVGLGAIRERSYSSPGPSNLSSSPPVARGHLAAHVPAHQQQQQPQQQQHQQQQQQQLHDQPLPRGRDRPPRSQPYDSYGVYQGDRSIGGISLPLSTMSSRSDPNLSLESNDSRGFLGAIARPELRQSATEFDPSRLRSSSADNYQQNPYGAYPQQPQPGFDPVSHKFGTLPTLGAHLQQQRGPQEQYANLQKPRHVRSVSQPGPVAFTSAPQQVPHGVDPRYYGGSMSSSRSYTAGSHVRGGGSGQPVLPAASYEAPRYHSKGGSVPNLGGFQPPGVHPSLQRRDALDFHGSTGSQTSEDVRSYTGGGGMITPGQSPLHGHYPSHVRQPSDSGSAMLSSSPISMGSGIMHGSSSSAHTHQRSNDDDLALVGEHIEVPDHDEHGIHGSYMVQSGHHPLLGPPPTHAHTVSLDQLPPQFIETGQHHLPTAGASLSMPKVVYSVKFKRTQRNFVLGPRINRDLKIGTYVKVEADRGEDLGIVVGRTSAEKYAFSSRSSFTAGMGPSSSLGGAAADLKRIIRLATHDEVSLLSMKREEEDELLKICRGKVRQRGLPMHVVDAEYQFDRHKLTFFFEAEGRVDFRELVRDLFSMYKTRIWMQQLDKNTSTSAQAIIAPQTSNLQMDYGTPIIAPVSEFADSVVLSGLPGGDARTH